MTKVVDQISVFLEHKPGKLADFCGILQRAGVDMKALSLAKATDYGVARVIVDKLDVAQEALRAAGQIFSITQVIGVELKDEVGSLYKLLEVLKDANINIKYCYAVTKNRDNKAHMIIRVSQEDIDRTLELLK